MKRIILFAVSAIALAFTGCQHQDPVRDALIEKAGNLATVSDITYDAAYSSSKVLSIYWNPESAINAGASSFKIVVSEELFEFSDAEAGASNSKTYEVKANATPNDALRITSDIVEGTPYYIKVAAVYPGPSTSAWVYLLGEDGEPAPVVAGQGIVK